MKVDPISNEPTPDDFIVVLESRIAWIKAHKKAVEVYLDNRSGPRWVRVIHGSKSGAAD